MFSFSSRSNLILLILLSLLTLTLGRATPAAAQQGPPVLAFYYAWFDQNTWSSGQSVDLPAQPYVSAERATIERHVAEAQGAGIDAFVQSWYGPQVENNQTETNFRTLLEVAQSRGFQAAVDLEVSGPFFPDAGAVTNALATLLATHAQHPAYFRYQGKPVIFFWRQQRFPVEQWQAIRDQVDPNRSAYWIAEGVDISYQAVFDGHHLYSIAWAASPAGQLAKWGDRVRAYEAENGVERLWVATAMPGYNDTRLPRQDSFAVPRREGGYYRETWQGALASGPEMIIITSFNEWPEGTHLEPSASYGNFYLDLTRDLVTELRGNPPAAPVPPAPAAAPAESPPAQDPPPDGPYIQVEGITNVRLGPGLTFTVTSRLPANSAVPVVGRVEDSSWWQIEANSAPDGLGWVAGEVVDFVGEVEAVPVVEPPPPPPEEEPAGDDANAPLEPTPAPVEEAEEAADAPAQVTSPAGGVNLRSGPGLDFEEVGRLPSAETAPVLARDPTGRWWQIETEAAEAGVAWVAAAVVTFEGESATVPIEAGAAASGDEETEPTAEAVPAEPTPTAPLEPVIAGSIEALEAINVRSEPTTGGVVLGGLFPGQSADVLAMSQDGDWWQIDFVDAPGQEAWVAREFARFSGDRAQVPIFELGTPTPTPGPTRTRRPTATPTATATIPANQPTLAPTATSVYQATSAALLAQRGTPDPTLRAVGGDDQAGGLAWEDIPWGLLSLVVIAGFFWYQFTRRRRGRR